MATRSKRTAEIMLRFKVQRGDIETARRGVSTLEGSVESFGGEIANAAKKDQLLESSLQTLGKTSRSLAPAMDVGTTAIERQGDAAENALVKLDRLDRAVAESGRSAQFRAQLPTGGTSLQAVGRASQLGEIGAGAQTLAGGLSRVGAGEIAKVVGGGGEVAAAMGALGLSLGAVAAVALPVGLAIGGVALAFKKFKGDIEGVSALLNAALAGQEKFFTAVQEGTVKSITGEIEALNARRIFLQTEVANSNRLTDDLNLGGKISFGIGQAVGRIRDGEETLRQVRKKQEDELTDNEVATKALTNALNSQEVATRVIEVGIRDHIGAIGRQAEIEKQANQLSITGTSEQLDARLKAIELERQFIESQLDGISKLDRESQSVIETTGELTRALFDLATEEELLTSKTLDAIAAREADTESQEKRIALINATQKFNDDRLQIRAAADKEELRINQRFADAQVSIAENAAKAAQRALETLERQQERLRTRLARGGQDARIKAQDDALDARIKLLSLSDQFQGSYPPPTTRTALFFHRQLTG